jgi:hypothetical protein
MTPAQPPLPFPVWLLLVFLVAWWCVVLTLVAWLGGWRRLAERFPASTVPAGPMLTWQSIRLGFWTGYNNCVTIRTTPDGLYLAVIALARPGHPPLFIPWRELTPLRENPGFLSPATVTLAVGQPRIATLTIPKTVYDQRPEAG